MLATLADRPFRDPGWLFELKHDGVRALVRTGSGGTTVTGRSGRDETLRYPELLEVGTAVAGHTALIDGEIVALEADGADVRRRPLSERTAELREILHDGRGVRYADHVRADGTRLLEVVSERGLLGIVARRVDAPYRPGRGRATGSRSRCAPPRTASCAGTPRAGARAGRIWAPWSSASTTGTSWSRRAASAPASPPRSAPTCVPSSTGAGLRPRRSL